MKLKRLLGRRSGDRPDYLLLAVLFLLVIGGLVVLSSASSDLGKIKINDSYYYIKHQILYGLLPGLLGFLIAYFVPYRFYRKIALPFLLANLFLLTLVFTPLGVTTNGASRWLALGPVTFQPAEFLKISFILYLAAWFANPTVNRNKNITEGLLPFIIISALTAGLLLAQPATSTVVILLCAAAVIYFIAGAQWKHIISFVLVGAAVIGLLVIATPYRLARVSSFLSKDKDSQGANYHLNQALIALGSGGVFGVGYGQSTSKVRGLPEAMDDSIFAVVGQEMGFVGSGILLALFGLLTFRLFWLARRTRDNFGKLILIGFGTIITFQAVVNVGAISGLLPLTGIPLPFVSYGGTALAVFVTMGGVSVNISRYT
jgi:cell division protein FtsW